MFVIGTAANLPLFLGYFRVMRTAGLSVPFFVVLLFAAASVVAGQKTFVLEDHVNRRWTRELVSFPVPFERGECRARSIGLRGPKGAVACQFTDVAHWPGTDFVKTATLWFVGGAPPLTRNEYKLAYGPQPPAGPIRSFKTDLQVTKNPGGGGSRHAVGRRRSPLHPGGLSVFG